MDDLLLCNFPLSITGGAFLSCNLFGDFWWQVASIRGKKRNPSADAGGQGILLKGVFGNLLYIKAHSDSNKKDSFVKVCT